MTTDELIRALRELPEKGKAWLDKRENEHENRSD